MHPEPSATHQRFSGRLFGSAIVVLWVVLAAPLFGQSLPIQNFTTDDGLSYAQVWSLLQDSRGYLWIGTSAGPNRWDGASFTTFGAADGLASETVRAIIEDDRGVLWFGTEDGVASFDGREFRNYVDIPGLDGTIWGSTKDRYGRVWFGTHLNGATFVENGEFRTVDVDDGLASKYVYGLFADSKGFLWFGHRGDGVTRCQADFEAGVTDCRRFGTDDGLPDPNVRAFAEDSRGIIYVGTRGGGIARWDGERFEPISIPDSVARDIYSLLVTPDDELAIATLNHGVAFCRLPELDSCRALNRTNGLPDDVTLSLLRDREGAFWAGFESGLSRISFERMLGFTVRDGLPHSTSYAVLGLPDGSVLIGTLGGLVQVRIDEETSSASEMRTYTAGNGLPGAQVWDLLLDSRKRVWVATDGGLCEFDSRRGRCSRVIGTDEGLPNDDLNALRERSEDEIVVSTTEGVSLVSLDGSKVSVRNLSIEDGLAGNVIYGIATDRYGRLWIGSDQGLSLIGDDRIESFSTKDGLPLDDIHALLSDRQGRMWVGTNGGGLSLFEPPPPGSGERPVFTTWDEADGVNPFIAAITENEEGLLWLGTFRGAVLFDPDLALEGKSPVIALVDRSTGLVSNEINGFTFDAFGNLWIAAAGGATRYDPEASRSQVPQPDVAIQNVVTPHAVWTAPFSKPDVERDRYIWLDAGRLELPPGSASIRIDYRGLSFRGPNRVRYQVRLEGFRDIWSDETTATFKEYTNLFPGLYAFEVRASVRRGAWGKPSRLEMEILPAWWQRRSYIAATALGLVFLLVLAYRARTYAINRRNLELARAVDERTEDLRRYAKALEEHSHALDRANFRIREADRVKSEFLANMSHELRTPLNSIIGFSDVLIPALDARIDDRHHRFLRNIQMSGRYLLLLINNLLDLSKIEAGRADVVAEPARVDEIVATTCEIVRGYAADRRIEVVATAPDSMPEVVIDVPKFRQILLNLLSNAVKFSKGGSAVEVEVREVPESESELGVESFELLVRDHGPGISATDREAIFEEFRQVGGGVAHPDGTGLGLALVRRFVELLTGKISVDSSPGEGSSFRVLLPQTFESDPGGASAGQAEDSAQPRVIVLSAVDEVFSELAETLEREGFAPVRARSADDAARIANRVDPVAAIATIELDDVEGWNAVEAVGSDPNLSSLMVGICLTTGGRIEMAIGADGMLLEPFSAKDARAHVLTFSAPEGSDPVFLGGEQGFFADLAGALSGPSWTTRRARTPAQAVSMVTDLQPGVVIVDLAADSLCGFDAVRRIQVGKATRHTPVVLVTPKMLDAPTRASFLTTTFDEIASPLDELGPTLHELLRRRSARAVRLAAASLA